MEAFDTGERCSRLAAYRIAAKVPWLFLTEGFRSLTGHARVVQRMVAMTRPSLRKVGKQKLLFMQASLPKSGSGGGWVCSRWPPKALPWWIISDKRRSILSGLAESHTITHSEICFIEIVLIFLFVIVLVYKICFMKNCLWIVLYFCIKHVL